MTTPTIRAALERLIELQDDTRPTSAIAGAWIDAIAAARAALAAEPVVEGPTEALVDDLFNRFADSCDEYGLWSMGKDGLRAALARWGHPTPPAPEPGEVAELVARLRNRDRWTQLTDAQVDRAATLLEQLSAPAPPAPEVGEVGL